jgi:hypothetical protein
VQQEPRRQCSQPHCRNSTSRTLSRSQTRLQIDAVTLYAAADTADKIVSTNPKTVDITALTQGLESTGQASLTLTYDPKVMLPVQNQQLQNQQVFVLLQYSFKVQT